MKFERASMKIYLIIFDKAFEIDYAHNSTAIEGNTLSLIETKVLIENQISVGNKSLCEIYEVVNHIIRKIDWSILIFLKNMRSMRI